MENPFKKYFGSKDSDEKDKKRDKSSKFKKFEYTEDEDDFFDLDDLFSEFNGNAFNFHGFPPSILKQFQEIVEAMQQFDEDPENNQRRKSFENKYNDFRQKTDKDLDGQIYADQLDTLLRRISPDHAPKESSSSQTLGPQKKIKLTDEEKIMDIIHGTFKEEVVPVKPRKRQVQKVPPSPHHFGGMPPFGDFPPTSSRTWGRTVISIRKPDGSYETRKTERGADGQTTTTITRTEPDGTSLTQSFIGDGKKASTKPPPPAGGSHEERNLVMFDGYKIPCLW
ncbi:CLUMA_CG014338, isoform A [Clunio marinus]|uniref:CLUMA_CG014338, isoform A n=1 Tax=Clunio marinus TaxID=568069 RepID=A0A1J1ISW0_9DIPT|nr:CLUMA_CG014338, isoform A [Clunio marinus]